MIVGGIGDGKRIFFFLLREGLATAIVVEPGLRNNNRPFF